MNRGNARVGLGGNDGESAVMLDGGEQERPRTGKAEQVLAADGPASLLDHVLLGVAGLVEGAHRDEAAVLRDGLGPHATAAASDLLEHRLNARVEHGAGLAVEREAPLESGHPEAT